MLDARDMYTERYRALDNQNLKLDFSGPVKQRKTRTAVWPKYYIIDFGASKQYPLSKSAPLDWLMPVNDEYVPEFRNLEKYDVSNPFPIDVFMFGNMIRLDFMDVSACDSLHIILPNRYFRETLSVPIAIALSHAKASSSYAHSSNP